MILVWACLVHSCLKAGFLRARFFLTLNMLNLYIGRQHFKFFFLVHRKQGSTFDSNAMLKIYSFIRSGGGVVDNTLDYQSRGRKIDPPLLRSFG